MNRTIRGATVKPCHHASHDALRAHLQLVLNAYDRARRLKTLRGLTPYQSVARIWTEHPARLKADPHRFTSGLNA